MVPANAGVLAAGAVGEGRSHRRAGPASGQPAGDGDRDPGVGVEREVRTVLLTAAERDGEQRAAAATSDHVCAPRSLNTTSPDCRSTRPHPTLARHDSTAGSPASSRRRVPPRRQGGQDALGRGSGLEADQIAMALRGRRLGERGDAVGRARDRRARAAHGSRAVGPQQRRDGGRCHKLITRRRSTDLDHGARATKGGSKRSPPQPGGRALDGEHGRARGTQTFAPPSVQSPEHRQHAPFAHVDLHEPERLGRPSSAARKAGTDPEPRSSE